MTSSSSEREKTGLQQAGENLFNFAVDREDVKSLVAQIPADAKCPSATVEYELHILKIITTGWSISFFLGNRPHLDRLAENFWEMVKEFSASLSETTGLMTSHDIDYFQILKDRLDLYVAALAAKPGMTEPAAVVGPEFARLCGDADDIFSIMTGARMFILTVARVKKYLDGIELQL